MNKLIIFHIAILFSCTQSQNNLNIHSLARTDTASLIINAQKTDTSELSINTGNTTPQQVVDYAKTLIGVPYKYASTDPQQGFDCSGFITYVFNHFNINVPRSSVDFTNIPHEVSLIDAKPGDLILFTGTDSTIRRVGHMGIVVFTNKNELLFIHSNSGKAHAVTITLMNDYYKGRFMKVIRVFPQND
jgi:cell wall-associated NlpC family hydrolase